MPEVRDSLATLIEGAQSGDVRKIARLISKIEDGGNEAREAMRALAAYSGRAHVIGLTGAPGVGKSTTTSALVTALRAAGHRVAVLAVDPSSPFSGGALLGDRIRMQRHSGDDGVYIRSMASRGHLGGLSATTPQVIRVLDATGFDIVIIETVGVGQSEVEIAATADTSIVLLAPGMGDGIQAAKAGILEIGDIFVVNKADRDGADSTAREIRHMVELGTWSGWRPPVLKASAAQGTGIDEVVEAINEHRAWLEASGEDRVRRHRRAREEITALVLGAVRERLAARADELMALGDAVLAGDIDAYEAAETLA
jgi:LAO/AO transport system kinase